MGNKPRRQYTCTYIIRQNPETHKAEVLLGKKKRGQGVDTFEGYGGKVEKFDASIEKAAWREFQEESATKPMELHKFGIVDLYFPDCDFIMECHLFYGYGLEGEPQETEEMIPFWFPIDSIPFDSMGDDYRYWWQLFRNDKMFVATFLFDDHYKVKAKHWKLVDEFPVE